MNINSIEFKNKLKELCDNNWKAKSIMKANDNDFINLPDYQQKMFLKKMNIAEVTTTIKAEQPII